MAAFPDTPSLPEIKPLSRRHVMTGAAAALSVMTGAAMARAAVAGNPDAELLAACREWWKGHEALQALWAVSSRMDRELDAVPIPVPSELREPVEMEGHEPLTPESGTWHSSAVQNRIASGGGFECHMQGKETPRRTIIIEDYAYPKATMNRLRELLVICEEHERQVEITLAPAEEAQANAEAAATLVDERCRDLLAMPARTIGGFYAKTKVLRANDLVFTEHDDDEALVIFADIEALAMETRIG